MNKSKRFKTKLYGVTDANQSEQRAARQTGAIESYGNKPSSSKRTLVSQGETF